MFEKNKELEFLNNVAQDYLDVSPYSQVKKDIILGLIKSSINTGNKKKGLQLGCANGYETEMLSGIFEELDVVDGSSIFIERLEAKSNLPNVNYIFSLFEDLPSVLSNKYNYIVCSYILEHVYDSILILKNLRELLTDDGSLFVVVPNANALSRSIAMEMKFISSLTELTPNDHKHGHRRVYTLNTLQYDVNEAELEIVQQNGIVFKILADFQLNSLLEKNILTNEHIWALQRLAQGDNIHFADSIFLELKKRK